MAHQAQRGKHQDADTRTEVTAIKTHEQLVEHRPGEPVRPRFVGDSPVEPSLERLLNHEQKCREADKHRDDHVENAWRCQTQQNGASATPDNARDDERIDTRIDALQLAAVCPDAAQSAWPNRHRVRGVGVNGGNAQPDECRKRKETSAAGNRVDAARDDGCDEHEGPMQQFVISDW